MRWHVGFSSLTILFAVSAATPAQDDSLKHALALEETVQKIIAKAEPSIGCILVSRSDAYKRFDVAFGRREPGQLGGFERPEPVGRFHRDFQTQELAKRLDLSAPETVPDSYGSGVVIDKSGLILTNFHVVRDATKIFVRLPERGGWYADIYAADERSDLAVLKLIPARGDALTDLPALVPGDADKAKKGQFVISLSNPHAAGFRDGSASVSWGMLSNLRRRVPGEPNEVDRRRPRLHYYGYLMQTDCRVTLGSSGGALLDLKGNWIGLTTAQAALMGGESTGGFVVPLDARMKRIIEVLRQGKEMEYGFMGVSLPQRSDGVYIGRVSPNSPAAMAGLSGDEKIIKADIYPVRDNDDVFLSVGAYPAGSTIRLTVAKAGREWPVNVKLAKAYWPASGPIIAANRPTPVHGMRVDYTSTQLRGLIGENVDIPLGVLVREVAPGSPAAQANLRPDTDIITEVNGKRVNSPSEFYEAAAHARTLELTLSDPMRKVKLP